jgi:hypothetical protein
MSTTSHSPARWPRIILIGSLLGVSWLGMQIVHELGHVLGALATGGKVMHVELKPWSLSRTDVLPGTPPLIEIWAGPIVGVLLPVALWLAARGAWRSWAYLLRFFAGFCLVANGCYIGCGVFLPVGDAADILVEWPARWPMGLFGVTTIIPGLALWNGLGERFGLGKSRGQVDRRHAVVCATILIAIIAAEVAC